MTQEKRSQYEKLESKLSLLKARLSESTDLSQRKYGVIKE